MKNAPVQKPAPKVVHNYATTHTTLFKSASDKSAKLGSFQRHTKVEVVGKFGSFSKVKVSGKNGFIASKNLAATNTKSKKITTLNQNT